MHSVNTMLILILCVTAISLSAFVAGVKLSR